jgi:hypothetical protein
MIKLFCNSFKLCALTVVALSFSSTIFINKSNASERLDFDYRKNTAQYSAVRNALADDLESFYEENPDALPAIAIARTDLNQDGKDEIIAVLNGMYEFCEHSHGRGHNHDHPSTADTCPHYIFTYTRSGLIKIGDFKTVGITIADTATNGIRDIITFPEAGNRLKTIFYKWAGRSYKAAQ